MEIILNSDSARKTPLAVVFKSGERYFGDAGRPLLSNSRTSRSTTGRTSSGEDSHSSRTTAIEMIPAAEAACEQPFPKSGKADASIRILWRSDYELVCAQKVLLVRTDTHFPIFTLPAMKLSVGVALFVVLLTMVGTGIRAVRLTLAGVGKLPRVSLMHVLPDGRRVVVRNSLIGQAGNGIPGDEEYVMQSFPADDGPPAGQVYEEVIGEETGAVKPNPTIRIRDNGPVVAKTSGGDGKWADPPHEDERALTMTATGDEQNRVAVVLRHEDEQPVPVMSQTVGILIVVMLAFLLTVLFGICFIRVRLTPVGAGKMHILSVAATHYKTAAELKLEE